MLAVRTAMNKGTKGMYACMLFLRGCEFARAVVASEVLYSHIASSAKPTAMNAMSAGCMVSAIFLKISVMFILL